MQRRSASLYKITTPLLTLAALGGGVPQASAQEDARPAAQAAQSSSVRLLVRAKGSGNAVGRVEVKVGGSKSYSDKGGSVDVQIPAGDGEVELYRHSYEPLRISYAELRGKASYEVFLLPATPPDNEVLVTGNKRPEVSRKSVTIEEAVKVAPGGDPAQVPKLLPGVQASTFRPEIVVRGSGPNDSSYYIDNFQVPFIFHAIGGISIMPDQLLSGVEFSTGGFGAQYGNTTGGVVTLQTKTEIPERPKTEFRVNLPVFSSIYHERPIGDDAMVAVSARRSYLDAFLPAVLPKDSGVTIVPYFGDAHVYYFKQREDGHIKFLGLYAYDGLKATVPTDVALEDDGRARFALFSSVTSAGVEWKKILNKDWTLTTSPQISTTTQNIDILDNRIHISANVASVQSEATRRYAGQDKLYVGTNLSVIQGKVDVYAPKPDENDPFYDYEEAPKVAATIDDTYEDAAVWVAGDKELGKVLVTPGVRTFYSSSIKKSGADPRLAVRYKLDEQNALKGAVGQYSQTPEFRDTSKDFGNPDLDFIHSYHYVLGIETNWSERWTTDFQTFYKETKNAVRSDPNTNTNNDGSLISAGFEAFVRRNLTQRLFGWLAYTYSRTRERDNDGETYRNSQYDQTHVLNLVGNYKITAQWEAGGRVVYHTGDTYTGVDDAVYNANLDKYQARTAPTTRLYNKRMPAYHEVDVFATKEFLYDTWKLGLRFGIEYLAMERQAQGVQYNYDYSKEEYFRGVPPIPYLELRGTL